MKRYLKRNATVLIIVIIFCILMFGFLLADYENQYENWITITSFIVSMVALIVALITYFSIDSLNGITSMNGNVLDNASYSVAYTEMLRNFVECNSKEDFQEKLMAGVSYNIENKSDTCMKFYDSIQYVIDRIILFAYLDYNDPSFSSEKDKLKKTLKNRYREYSILSNGIQYTLHENIKLITYVFEYQQNRQKSGEQTENVLSGLEDIRESMIHNPITKIVFYDYLGLHYRRKASELLKPAVDLKGAKEFSTDYMIRVWEKSFDDDARKKASWFLDTAEKSFRRAKEIADEDILWNGFLSYNVARTKIMAWLLNKPEDKEEADNITTLLAQTVSMRDKMFFYYGKSEICGNFLSEKLMEEYKLAVDLQQAFAALLESI